MQTPKAKSLFENLLLEVGTTSGRDNFLDLIRRIESDNRLMVSPDDTSAKGVYQFTDKSVETAKTRAINMGLDKGIINLIPDNPQQWTDDEADVLTLSNLFAQSMDLPGPIKGSGKGLVDDLLVDAFGGNRRAMQDAYYMLHHTKPDDATKRRVDKFMPLVGPLMEENFPDKK
jgi:hypothetical protein